MSGATTTDQEDTHTMTRSEPVTARPQRPRPAADVLERLRQTPTAWIGDYLRRVGVVNCEIKDVHNLTGPANPASHLAGTAFTVRYAPVQYLEPPGSDARTRSNDVFITRMHDLTERGELVAGDVVVIAAHGAHYGFWGESTSAQGLATGVGGAVVDGCIRDIASTREMGFDCFAKGNSFNRHDDRYEIVDMQVPVECGGATVCQGDVVVGDEDGVVVIPRDALDDLMANGIAAIAATEGGFRKLLETYRGSEA
jgi:regulator of RNase E activity RraA